MITAHEARNTATKRHQAVSDIIAQHRWCLTGTPIQNTLDDLAALVAFLKVPILEDRQIFRRFITPHMGVSLSSRYESLQTLLGTICLRRTRQVLNLPEPLTEAREVILTEKERCEYNAVIEKSQEMVDISVSKRGTRSLNAAVLESLLRLRLFCNSGSASIKYSEADGMPSDPDEALSYLQQCDRADCVYCQQQIYSLSSGRNTEGGHMIPACQHLVCYQCMSQFQQDHRNCPSKDCTDNRKTESEAKPRTKSSAAPTNTRKRQKRDENINTSGPQFQVDEIPSKLQKFLQDLEFEMSGFSKPKW